MGEEHGSAFRWPPKSGGAAAPEPGALIGVPARAALVPRWARARAWWLDIERTWLDPSALPLGERLDESGWEWDGFDAYCDRCGADIGPFESDEFGCTTCRGKRLSWERVVRLGSYAGLLSEWVCEVKFTRARGLAMDLGAALGERVRDAGVLRTADARPPIVVPVPTTLRRRMERGIDHAGLLARGVGRALGLKVVRALARRHRPSQRAVAPSARARNVAGSIRLVRPGEVQGRQVVLVDDVMTTGATLRAAARTIASARRHGNGTMSIIGAVVAVTPGPERLTGGRARSEGLPAG